MYRLIRPALELLLVSLFSSVPFLLHSFDIPAGEDAYRLETQPLVAANYFGHYLRGPLPITWYYYLTPIIVYLGLKYLLGPKGFQAWLVFILLVPTFNNYMGSGSFLPVINTFTFGVVALKFRDWRSVILGIIAVLFHTTSGIWILGTSLIWLTWSRKWTELSIAGAVAVLGSAYIAVNLDNSLTNPEIRWQWYNPVGLWMIYLGGAVPVLWWVGKQRDTELLKPWLLTIPILLIAVFLVQYDRAMLLVGTILAVWLGTATYKWKWWSVGLIGIVAATQLWAWGAMGQHRATFVDRCFPWNQTNEYDLTKRPKWCN